MALGVNKVILIGHVGQAPETRYTANGMCVARFSVATAESYKDKDGNKQTATEWHNITCFGKLGEICEKYLNKGAKVYIEGKIKTEKWQDKTTGQDRYTTKIIGEQLQLLGSSKEESPAAEEEAPPMDDLPY